MIRLECTIGGHNKYYEFVPSVSKGRFTVIGRYGAIGQAPKEAIMYDGDSKDEANEAYRKKLAEKQKKGYVIVSNDGKPVPAPAPATEEKKTAQSLVMFP
jgi:predicted DNA-binding WGR domain protein